jgi:hypothetical protein
MGTERTTNLEHMDTKEFGQYTWIFLLFQLCDSCWHSWVAYESSLLLEFVTCGSHCTQSFLKVLKISKLLKSLNTCLHLMFRAHTHTHTHSHTERALTSTWMPRVTSPHRRCSPLCSPTCPGLSFDTAVNEIHSICQRDDSQSHDGVSPAGCGRHLVSQSRYEGQFYK